MREQTRIVDLFNGWVLFQEAGDGLSILFMLTHTYCKSFDATQREPGIHGSWNRACRILMKLERLINLLITRNHYTTNNIAVSINVFCRTMKHNICPQVQWLLEVWAGEGVVHDEQDMMTMGNCGDCLNIYESKQRIGGRLQPDQFCGGANGLLICCDISIWHIARLNIIAAYDTFEQTVCSTIEIVASNQMVTRTQQAENSALSSQARGECQTIFPVFERSNTRF